MSRVPGAISRRFFSATGFETPSHSVTLSRCKSSKEESEGSYLSRYSEGMNSLPPQIQAHHSTQELRNCRPFITDLSQFADDFARRIRAASARQAIARMRSGTTEEQPANWRLVARPIEHRPHGEELVQRKLAVKNVAPGETVTGFQVLRRDDLHSFHQTGEIRRVGAKCVDHRQAEVPSPQVPMPFSQLVRSALHVNREHMFAVGRERRIENRGNGGIQVRRFGNLTVLRIVEGALQVVNVRPNVNAAGEGSQCILVALERGKTGQTAKREIHLRHVALRAKILDAIREDRIELGRINEMKESAFRIDAGNDGRSGH